MADPWELILHHTYTGTPGVVCDQSPGRGSHGVAVNLADSDFLVNGVAAGSGAVTFHPGSSIRVSSSNSWRPLGGIRGEFVCNLDSSVGQNTLIDGGSFRVAQLSPGSYGAWFTSAAEHYGIFGSAPFVPTGRWITLGFGCDGASTMELYVNGAPINQITMPMRPIDATASVSIGSNAAGQYGVAGRIDDVKIWRINPHRVGQEFTSRPVDERVKNCWAQWSRALGTALHDNPGCAIRLRDLLIRAVQSIVRDGLNAGDQTRARWQDASDTYRKLWAGGSLADIAPLMADLMSYLQLVGPDPSRNPDVATLLNDSCVETILRRVPKIDCDPQFTHLGDALKKTVTRRSRGD
jgi:hypothetical protein